MPAPINAAGLPRSQRKALWYRGVSIINMFYENASFDAPSAGLAERTCRKAQPQLNQFTCKCGGII